MTLTTQTQNDLHRVIEMLDQRIFELSDGRAQPASHEAMQLQSLRSQAAALLPCEMT